MIQSNNNEVFTFTGTTYPSGELVIDNLQDYKYALIVFSYADTYNYLDSVDIPTDEIGKIFFLSTYQLSGVSTYAAFRNVIVDNGKLTFGNGVLRIDMQTVTTNNTYAIPRRIILHN